MQLTFNFEDTATPQSIAAKLRMQAGLLEGLTPKDAASRKNTDSPKAERAAEADETDNDDDSDFTANSTTKTNKKSAVTTSFDDATDDEDADFTAPAKTAKPEKKKKWTIDDVNDACKARAAKTGGKKGRAEVLAILTKKFETTSVSELEPEQYAEAIAAMKV